MGTSRSVDLASSTGAASARAIKVEMSGNFMIEKRLLEGTADECKGD